MFQFSNHFPCAQSVGCPCDCWVIHNVQVILALIRFTYPYIGKHTTQTRKGGYRAIPGFFSASKDMQGQELLLLLEKGRYKWWKRINRRRQEERKEQEEGEWLRFETGSRSADWGGGNWLNIVIKEELRAETWQRDHREKKIKRK